MAAAVEADSLVRTYRTKTGFLRRSSKTVEAVKGISFSIDEGELFGVLGPNGAGKTTTIKLLTTLLLPTSGRATVRAACASGCTSRAACCTTRRSSSSTSRRSGSTRSEPASSGW